jgi:hypothetical protein
MEKMLKRIVRGILTTAEPLRGRIATKVAPGTAAYVLIGVCLFVCASRAGSGATFDSATLAASKSLEAKMQTLESKESNPAGAYPAVVITEYEANAYLKVHSAEFLPPGVRTPSIKVQPEHVTGAADVDFDQLSRSYPNPNDMGPKILAAMFHGVQHVTVTASIRSQPAGVVMQVESVVVGSMTVPSWLVQYVIQNVLQPRYDFDLSKPIPYPDHVTQIVLGSGQVTFLRGPGKSR